MALSPLVLKLIAQDEASRVVRSLESNVRSLDGTLDDAADEARELDAALQGIDGAPLRDIERDAQGAGEGFDVAAINAAALTERLSNISETGARLANVGAQGMAMADGFIAAAREGRGIEQRLESILDAQGRIADMPSIDEAVGDITKRGSFADDDEIRNSAILLASFNVETRDMAQLMELGARQARTMGMSIDSVATGLGKAYSTGNIAALKRTGVVLSEAEIAAVKAAYAMDENAGRMAFMAAVAKGVGDNTVRLENSLTEQQKAANDAARAWDDFATSAGTGAENARAQIDNLGLSVLSLVGQNPQLAEGAGYLLAWGSMGAQGLGTLMQFTADTVIALQGLSGITKLQTAATWASATASAVQAKAVAAAGAASAAAGGAAGVGAAGFLALATAIGLALIAIAGFVVAWKGAQDASSMSDTALEEKWGGLGKWWASAGRAIGDKSGVETEEDRKLLEFENKRRAKRGQAPLSMSQFKGDPTADDGAPSTPASPRGDKTVTGRPVTKQDASGNLRIHMEPIVLPYAGLAAAGE